MTRKVSEVQTLQRLLEIKNSFLKTFPFYARSRLSTIRLFQIFFRLIDDEYLTGEQEKLYLLRVNKLSVPALQHDDGESPDELEPNHCQCLFTDVYPTLPCKIQILRLSK